jgi:hypothetical protein
MCVSREIFELFWNFFLNLTYTRVKIYQVWTLKNRLFLHFEDFNRWRKALKISEFWTYFWTHFFNSTYTRVDWYVNIFCKHIDFSKSMFFRLEMYTRGRDDLHATKGSTFVYAWWFFLSSYLIPDKTYWHIFQVNLLRIY